MCQIRSNLNFAQDVLTCKPALDERDWGAFLMVGAFPPFPPLPPLPPFPDYEWIEKYDELSLETVSVMDNVWHMTWNDEAAVLQAVDCWYTASSTTQSMVTQIRPVDAINQRSILPEERTMVMIWWEVVGRCGWRFTCVLSLSSREGDGEERTKIARKTAKRRLNCCCARIWAHLNFLSFT